MSSLLLLSSFSFPSPYFFPIPFLPGSQTPAVEAGGTESRIFPRKILKFVNAMGEFQWDRGDRIAKAYLAYGLLVQGLFARLNKLLHFVGNLYFHAYSSISNVVSTHLLEGIRSSVLLFCICLKLLNVAVFL